MKTVSCRQQRSDQQIMFNISNYSYENCGKKCKNPDHGERINSALIKSSVAVEKIAAFIAKTCRNFAHIVDHQVLNYFYIVTYKRMIRIS